PLQRPSRRPRKPRTSPGRGQVAHPARPTTSQVHLAHEPHAVTVTNRVSAAVPRPSTISTPYATHSVPPGHRPAAPETNLRSRRSLLRSRGSLRLPESAPESAIATGKPSTHVHPTRTACSL